MRALSMIASILLLFSISRQVDAAFPTSAKPTLPSVSAASAVLYERNSNSFIYDKDADTRRPMASTTKIATALVAARLAGSLDEIVTVPREAVGIEGSSLYLREGEELSLRELLYGLLLQSANDAAVAIAIHVSTSVESFVAEMNKAALELGLSNTHFSNPHGLHEKDHYSTARELAILASAALEEDSIRDIFSTVRHTIPANNHSPARTIVNHNKLLRLCDGAIGMKTGFTKASGRCLVGAFERDGLSFVSVTLSAPNDWDDHKKLFAYGAAALHARLVAPKSSLHYEIPIIGANCDSIRCTNAEDIVLVLPRDESTPEPLIHLSHFAVAPIRQGAVLGKIVYERNGKTLLQIPLVAEESVYSVSSQ